MGFAFSNLSLRYVASLLWSIFATERKGNLQALVGFFLAFAYRD